MRTHSSAAPVTTSSMVVMPPIPSLVGMETTPSMEVRALTRSSVDSAMTISMAVTPVMSSKVVTASMPFTAVMTTTPSPVGKVLTT